MNDPCERCPMAPSMLETKHVILDMLFDVGRKSEELWNIQSGINKRARAFALEDELSQELKEAEASVARHLIFQGMFALEVSEDLSASEEMSCGYVSAVCPRIDRYGEILTKMIGLLEEFNNSRPSIAQE